MAVSWMTSGQRPDRPSVMAHRGGAALGDENSLGTLALAVAAGASSVEVDLVQTADGQLVLLHDSIIVAGSEWHFVRDLTADQVAEVHGAPPGTHLELLDECSSLGLGLYAEVKGAGPEALDQFVADVRRRDLEDSVCVASFRSDIVAHVAQQGVLDTSWLFWDPATDPAAVARDTGCTYVHPCFDLSPELLDLMEGRWMERLWDAGCGVVSWNTVDPVLMVRMAEVGLTAICTDDPRVVPADLTAEG